MVITSISLALAGAMMDITWVTFMGYVVGAVWVMVKDEPHW